MRCWRAADLIAFYLPMHTATRLAVPLIQRARALNGAATICAYGLYAPLNSDWLRGRSGSTRCSAASSSMT